MYLEHFGLERPPFKITPDTSMFYTGNKRGAALQALKYAITSGEGIIKVVGEVGSGKTMLCRMLEVELDDSVDVVYIANPSLSPENILHVIAFELKLNVTAESSKLEVMQALQNHLLSKHAQNKQVVVFVEEAQSMPIETLEEIRLLSNLETNDYKLLQMVLFGQPELDEKLRDPSIRQLKERITHNFYLDPFPASDVYEYLNFRMRAVGYRGPDLFTPKAAHSIEKKSHGLTRRINILADKALLAVFSEGGHDIRNKHITLAAKDSDFGHDHSWQPSLNIITGVLVILIAIWIGTLLPTLFNSQEKQINTVNTIGTGATAAVQTQNKPAPLPTENQTASQISNNDNLLEQRLELTQSWLTNTADSNFTIQLILLDVWAESEVRSYLDKASQFLDTSNLYIYKASIRGRMVYSVLYNDYSDRNQAINQLQQFSPWLKQNGPYLRTFKGIKADIRKTQNATQSSEAQK